MDRILSQFRQSKKINAIFISNVLLSFHYYLILYINSSFLNNYFSESQISTLYIIGSILNTVLLLSISRILNKIGNYKMAVFMIAFEILSTIGLIVSGTPFLIGLYFIIHQVAVSVIAFNLDIFLEANATDDSKTGEVRGLYMTLSNITIILATLLVSIILIGNQYWHVYFLSLLFLFPLYFVLFKNFRKTKDDPIEHIHFRETLLEYLKNKNLYNIFICQFLLQLFYAFMVVYTPLYLEKYVGFSWSEIGIMFTIMLLPFVFFEIPIGDLADEKYGEQEFMTVGFIIMGLSTIFISFITAKSFLIWATVLFMTRVGASFVEVTTDSYFFKRVDRKKTDVISFYRIARSISFVIAPILATVLLAFIPFEYIFMGVGIAMIVGTHFSLALVDTK